MKKRIYLFHVLILSTILLFSDFDEVYKNVRYKYTSSDNRFVMSVVFPNRTAKIDGRYFIKCREIIKKEKYPTTYESWSQIGFYDQLDDATIEIENPVLLPDNSRNLFSHTNQPVIIYPTIDTSNVIDMSSMFYRASVANPDVSSWDVSNVTDMSSMFSNTDLANPDVSRWNVSNVRNMSSMFSHTDLANPDVSSWNVSKVTDMSSMFSNAALADPNVSSWDVSNVTNMSSMFSHTDLANPDVSSWNVSKVTDMSYMFSDTALANPDVSSWDVSNVTNMGSMFWRVRTAKPKIINWNTSSVKIYDRFYWPFNQSNNFIPELGDNFSNMNTYQFSDEPVILARNTIPNLTIDLSNIKYKYTSDTKTPKSVNSLYIINGEPLNFIYPNNVVGTGDLSKVGTVDEEKKVATLAIPENSTLKYKGDIANQVKLGNMVTLGGDTSFIERLIYEIVDTSDNSTKQISYFMRKLNPGLTIGYQHEDNKTYIFRPFEYTITPLTIYVGDHITAEQLSAQISKKAVLDGLGEFLIKNATQGDINNNIAITSGQTNFHIKYRPNNNTEASEYLIDFVIPLTIKKINTNPIGKDISVWVYTILTNEHAKLAISNSLNLPEGTTYEFKNPVDTSTGGDKTATVVVTYPDKSQKEVNINIHVISENETYKPIGQDITVVKGTVLTKDNAKKAITNYKLLPYIARYKFKDPVDTSTEGDKPAVVAILYPDGSIGEVNITVHVISKSPYIPKGRDITVQKDKHLTDKDAKSGISNSEDLPNGTRYRFKDPVDTSTEGDKPAIVVVMYPDGRIDEVNIIVKVSPNIEKYMPIINKLNDVDTSVMTYSEDGIYFESNLMHDYYNKIYKIVSSNYLDGSELFGGYKVGYNHRVHEKVNVGIFTEYDYNIVHKIGLGFKYNASINAQNLLGFIRYRINYRDEILQHNVDLYTRYAGEYVNKVYIKGLISMLLSYGSGTKLDSNVSINHRLIARGDIGMRIGIDLSNVTKVYLEPALEFKYTTNQTLTNGTAISIVDHTKDYFNARLRLGLDHTFNSVNLGESISFDSNGKLKAKVYVGYKF